MSNNRVLCLSVRGEARQAVPPDRAEVAGRVIAAEPTKPQAVTAAAAVLDELTRSLAGLGGAPLTPETAGSALTWSAHSMTTYIEREPNPGSGRLEATGKILASLNVNVVARDFGLLDAIGAIFAGQDGFYIDGVNWRVDDDNAAWAAVRTAAIEAALHKGRDYARALGSTLTSVDHVADTGLLGGAGPAVPAARAGSGMLVSAGRGGDDLDVPSLDPVPVELVAVIEARFSALPVSLT